MHARVVIAIAVVDLDNTAVHESTFSCESGTRRARSGASGVTLGCDQFGPSAYWPTRPSPLPPLLTLRPALALPPPSPTTMATLARLRTAIPRRFVSTAFVMKSDSLK